jgi:hypothetical protein|eukprot:COSAG02_NODE_570_length_20203_cov_8.049990_4_plen_515_part_00
MVACRAAGAAGFALLACLRSALGHTDPPNLAELDCAVSELAVEFSSARFTNDPTGLAHELHKAFHLDECENVTAPPPGPRTPQQGGYSAGISHIATTGDVTLFVAGNGSDSAGDGSMDKPFATIHKAQAVVRKTPVAKRPKTTIFLRAGTHYLGSTLTLTPEDSGASADAPVTYSAYSNEAVTVSGGVPLGTPDAPLTWSPLATTVPGTSAFKATLPASAPTNFSTLFVDGERALWARFPNGNNKDITGMCYSKTQRPIEVAHPCNGYAKATGTVKPRPSPKPRNASRSQAIGRYGAYPNYDIMIGGPGQPSDPNAPGYTYADLFAAPGDQCISAAAAAAGATLPNCSATTPCTVPCSTPGSKKWFAHFDRMQSQTDTFTYDRTTWTKNSWSHPERGVVRFLGQPIWGSHTYPLKAMNQTAGTIELGAGGWQFADIGAVKGGNDFYVEGILEEVDYPTEWAVDPQSRELHFFPNQTMPAPPPPPPSFMIVSTDKVRCWMQPSRRCHCHWPSGNH